MGRGQKKGGVYQAIPPAKSRSSKQAADREVYSRLPRGAHAASESNRANESLRDYAQVERTSHYDRPGIVGRDAESAARLVPSTPVDFSPHDLRQAVEFAPESQR